MKHHHQKHHHQQYHVISAIQNSHPKQNYFNIYDVIVKITCHQRNQIRNKLKNFLNPNGKGEKIVILHGYMPNLKHLQRGIINDNDNFDFDYDNDNLVMGVNEDNSNEYDGKSIRGGEDAARIACKTTLEVNKTANTNNNDNKDTLKVIRSCDRSSRNLTIINQE